MHLQNAAFLSVPEPLVTRLQDFIFVRKHFLMGLCRLYMEMEELIYRRKLIYRRHLMLVIIFIIPVNYTVNEKKHKHTVYNNKTSWLLAYAVI
jgi:hypothetical protein